MKNPIKLAVLFIVLFGSDMLIGFISHYIGTTDGVFTAERFMLYLTETDPLHWVLVSAIAIAVCAFVWFIGE